MLLLALTIILIVIFLNIFYTYPRLRRAYKISHNAKVYTGRYLLGSPRNKPLKLFVVGDSGITGQEVPKFTDSAGGRFASMLANYFYVEYLNQAGIGKWVEDIDHEQIAGNWDIAICALGSNDLLHGSDVTTFKNSLIDLLTKLKSRSKYLIVAGPGDSSRSRIFAWWFRRIIRRRERIFAEAIMQASEKIGAHYFNPLTEPEIFEHFNKDGLHLSIKGNHLFADALWQVWLEGNNKADQLPNRITNRDIAGVKIKAYNE